MGLGWQTDLEISAPGFIGRRGKVFNGLFSIVDMAYLCPNVNNDIPDDRVPRSTGNPPMLMYFLLSDVWIKDTFDNNVVIEVDITRRLKEIFFESFPLQLFF